MQCGDSHLPPYTEPSPPLLSCPHTWAILGTSSPHYSISSSLGCSDIHRSTCLMSAHLSWKNSITDTRTEKLVSMVPSHFSEAWKKECFFKFTPVCSHLVRLWNTCKALDEPRVGSESRSSNQPYAANLGPRYQSASSPCSHWGWTQCLAPYTSSRAHRAAFPRPFFKNQTEKRVDQFPRPSRRSLPCSVSWRLSVGIR